MGMLLRRHYQENKKDNAAVEVETGTVDETVEKKPKKTTRKKKADDTETVGDAAE